MEIIAPKFKRGQMVSGVYKITFDNLHFYIGGSEKLKPRLSYWKHQLRSGKPKNSKIKRLLPSCKLVEIVVLEFINPEVVKVSEDVYIKQHWGNPLFLNKCPTAFDNTGVVYTDEDLAIRKKTVAQRPRQVVTDETRKEARNSAIARGLGTPVVKLDLNGNIIKTYRCISEAAENEMVDPKRIREILRGIGQKTKGMTFRKVDSAGNIIKPPVLLKKKKGRKRGIPGRPLTDDHKNRVRESLLLKFEKNPEVFMRGAPAKKVNIFDKNGCFVSSFSSINQASKALNIDSGSICKVLKNKIRHTNGYIFKYA